MDAAGWCHVGIGSVAVDVGLCLLPASFTRSRQPGSLEEEFGTVRAPIS
jgi:hypothetical protein